LLASHRPPSRASTKSSSNPIAGDHEIVSDVEVARAQRVVARTVQPSVNIPAMPNVIVSAPGSQRVRLDHRRRRV
jgi:hypothetical protein